MLFVRIITKLIEIDGLAFVSSVNELWYHLYMIQKPNSAQLKRSKYYLLIPVFAVIAFMTIGGVLFTKHDNVKASTTPAAKPSSQQSKFTFNSSMAPNWRQGPTNQTSLALFSNDHSCFLSFQYKDGTIVAADALQQTQDSLSKDGYKSIGIKTLDTSIQSSTSTEQYELHQYSVTGSGSAGQVYGGQEFGYLTLPNNHVFVQGNCNTAEQLLTTIEALQAVKLDESR